jgi:hypothetical protein
MVGIFSIALPHGVRTGNGGGFDHAQKIQPQLLLHLSFHADFTSRLSSANDCLNSKVQLRGLDNASSLIIFQVSESKNYKAFADCCIVFQVFSVM